MSHGFQQLIEKISIYEAEDFPLAPAPTFDDFARFEQETGFVFPLSYREFMAVFGPGAISGVFDIGAPFCLEESYDLFKYYQTTVSVDEEDRLHGIQQSKKSQQRSRIIRFGGRYRGESYGWDPADVVDPPTHEYGIFILRHDGENERITGSFCEFITEYCLGDRYYDFWDEPSSGRDWESEEDRWSFHRAYITS